MCPHSRRDYKSATQRGNRAASGLDEPPLPSPSTGTLNLSPSSALDGHPVTSIHSSHRAIQESVQSINLTIPVIIISHE